MVSPPVRTDEPAPNRRAPDLGADTDQILADIGYSTDRIKALRNTGVI